MNNEYLFCGRWYRPDYIDAHRSSMEPPSQTLPTEGGEATQRTKGEEKRIERNGGILDHATYKHLITTTYSNNYIQFQKL